MDLLFVHRYYISATLVRLVDPICIPSSVRQLPVFLVPSYLSSFLFLTPFYSISPTRPLPHSLFLPDILPPFLPPSITPPALSPSPRSCPAASEERANLFLYEPVVERFSGHQLVVGSFLDHHAFPHDDDLVGRANRRQAVSDHDARAAFLCSFQGLLHELTPTSKRQCITSISEANATSCLHS